MVALNQAWSILLSRPKRDARAPSILNIQAWFSPASLKRTTSKIAKTLIFEVSTKHPIQE